MVTVSFSKKLLNPRLVRVCSVLFWLFLIVLTLVNIGLFYRTLSPYGLCHRDLHQDYLQALAVRDNLDPFLSLEELARRYSPECENRFFPHPSPHTLTQLLLTLPLSYLGEWWFTLTWLLISLAAFLFALVRLSPMAPVFASQWRFLGLFLILFTSQPVMEDLWYGQVSILILALLAESFIRLRRGESTFAGALIGFSLALKPLAWLLVPFLVVRRPRAGITAGVVFGLFQLITAAVFGLDTVIRYYREVSLEAAVWWFPSIGNTSITGIFERVFLDNGVINVFGLAEPAPRSFNQDLIRLCLFVGLSGLTLFWALRSRTLEFGWCRILVFSPLLLPLTWVHYLVVYIPVFAIMFEKIKELPLSHRARGIFWVAFGFWWFSASNLGWAAAESGYFSVRWTALVQFIPTLMMVAALSEARTDDESVTTTVSVR